MVLIKLRNSLMFGVIAVVTLGAVQLLGDSPDVPRPGLHADEGVTVVLRVSAVIPVEWEDLFVYANIDGQAGISPIEERQRRVPHAPATLAVRRHVQHGDDLAAHARILGEAVVRLGCGWFLDDAHGRSSGTDITVAAVNGRTSATCTGRVP